MSTQPPKPVDEWDQFKDSEWDQFKDAEPVGAAALRGATGISETPKFQQDIRIPTGVFGNEAVLPSPERITELLPMIGGTVGMLGGPGGVIAGGAAGEGVRQFLRTLAGQPRATGVVQSTLGLDPNSLAASAAGIGAETVAGLAGLGFDKILRGIGGMATRSSKRSLVNLLQPVKQVDKEAALELTGRMRSEGIVPPLSSRASQVKRAEKALADATAKREAIEGSLSGQTLDATPVLESAIAKIPERLPGPAGPGTGGVPRTGRAERRAALNVAEDVLDSLGATGTGSVPFDLAQAEKRRMDAMLASFYEQGKLNVPKGTKAVKNVADAWRKTIANEFPEMGAANLRESELITITKLLTDAQKRIEREGMVGAAAEAAAGGSALAGRKSVPFAVALQAITSAGPYASLSAAAKNVLAKLVQAPAATSQAWIRMADFFNNPSEQAKAGETDAMRALREKGLVGGQLGELQ